MKEVVIYKALYNSKFGKNALWVRLKKEFLEEVKIDGKKISRFEFLG